ncbi:TetR/AcrR family transcriptional regulator [Psychromicrobium xiongbiense]|uniref:TetR/AcrR family transcriptional regulator n=1 Tax=Psychromicrobium xiongbiense TaxID=3051184 RepID=UPI002555E6EC|nr:TetR/AcrR family transcriptional regulator [Psychromicrobium sp. YIM S02556]
MQISLNSGPPEPENQTVEREDAARNRRKLLATASTLIAEHGIEALTMDELAGRACVGKGTIFRRFGNRAGLFEALLSYEDEQFQAALISGPPPLGPGAPPRERLLAYGQAVINRSENFENLLRAAQESSERRWSGPSSMLYRLHLSMLLRQMVPGPHPPGAARPVSAGIDPQILALTLFQALQPDFLVYQREGLGLSREGQYGAWVFLVDAVSAQLRST